ncbi:MAG: holo-ACP synthase [Deltaproteobacteria bacterium]|nr:holo-ACP synthase [Deltaproteobacteria bacterium]
MIYGTGIDIVEVQRMAGIIARWGNRFVERVFTPGEIAYCHNRALPAMHFAARFAAKESLLKSLGIGLGMGLSLQEIEVVSDQRGKPEVRLRGRAKGMLRRLRVSATHLSLSHTRHAATAVVILEKAGPPHA